MNLLGHIRCARTLSDRPAFWLGSALPDLQREAGVALGPAQWPDEVRAGIECHRAADVAFHELDVFRLQSSALTRALLDAGLPRGAARAIGHAGWELLFDGALLEDGSLVDGYLAAMSVDVSGFAAEWAPALARRVERGVPSFYADPAQVTELLWRVLARRRLLAFDRGHSDAVTACLRVAQPGIVSTVEEVFVGLG
ncbi:MAG TPA: hypothetical protein VMZ22_10700 [Acidimicrobiales bacterium]|nr:hypothetical protein [Acidimicrobiales bacterium]